MNTQAIQKKINDYIETATPEQIVKEFEDMGVEFVDLELTKEQYESIIEMNIAWSALSVGIRTKAFLEKELGLVHRLSVEYRKGLLQELNDKFNEAQSKVESTGALGILFKKLEY